MSEDKKKSNGRNYTELELRFLDVLMSEEAKGDIRTAMKMAGYAETSSPSAVIAALHEEIIDAAKKVIAANTMKATMATIDVINEPNALGAMNKLKAAQHLLDRAGVVKKEDTKDVNLKVPKGGLFILPAKAIAEEPEEETEDA